MKRLLLLPLSLMLCLLATSAPIGKDKALRIARSFIGAQGYISGQNISVAYSPQVATGHQTVATTRSAARANASQALYYVINNGSDNGFVVVAGDDRVVPILAYSKEGTLTRDVIMRHPSIHWLFDEYQRQIQWVLNHQSHAQAAVPTRAADRTDIEPLLGYDSDRRNQLPYPISWGQAWPFNLYAPNYKYKGTVYPTVSGCVATAISTVLRWHKWPNHPHGKTEYWWKGQYPMRLNFDGAGSENAPYDWKQMPAAITSGGYDRATRTMLTDKQADNIGRLLRDVGYALQMDYNPAFVGGSGAYVYNAPEALANNFGYKKDVRFLERNNYRKAAWLENIHAELKDYGPVVYAGFSQGGGHCFVLDGIKADGMVHVDWGWNRSQNGWYNLDVMLPGQEGIGGGSGGYAYHQQMLRYLQPDKQQDGEGNEDDEQPEPEPKSVQLYIASAQKPHYTIKQGGKATIEITVGNKGNDNYVGQVALAVYKSESDPYSHMVDRQTTLIRAAGQRAITFSVNTDELAPADYRLAICYVKDAKFVALQEQAGTLTVQGEQPTPTPTPTPVVDKPNLIVALQTFAYAQEGEHIKIPFTVVNKGGKYNGDIKLYAIPANASHATPTLISSGVTAIERGQSMRYTFYTNDAFARLTNGDGTDEGTKYHLLLAFHHQGKDFYAPLGQDPSNNHVGQLTIRTADKPEPTPQPQHGDIVLRTAYFKQGNSWLGSDYAVAYLPQGSLTVRYSLYSRTGYKGDVCFYLTQAYGSSNPSTNMYLRRNVVMRPGYGYLDVVFPTASLLQGVAYANLQYQVEGDDRMYFRANSQVPFYVRSYSYYDYYEPDEDDGLPRADLGRRTHGDTFDFLHDPLAYTKAQSIGNDEPSQDENISNSIVAHKRPGSFVVSPEVVAGRLTLVVPQACAMRLYAPSGQCVANVMLREGTNSVELAHLPRGVYVVRTAFGNAKIVKP
ncbi:C10 family peptidase [Prevotella sp. S7-1-8]|uniref:C10 family peptidase n=1 Tax=Prevotella sp. S7-1-8 TaxID=1284775 RepID=UPI0009DE32F9|nr:C10 family peptidase [Prevotella sp. S7-1-8]